MIKYLTSHRNSSALVIDKPILELLKISQKTPLEVSTDGQNLIISPVEDGKRESKMRSALAKVNKRHSKTLRSLAVERQQDDNDFRRQRCRRKASADTPPVIMAGFAAPFCLIVPG